jgi:hypothetical protein
MEAVLTICGRYARKIIISAGNYPLLSNSSTQANTRYSKMFGAYNASTLNAETIRQFVQWHHRIDSSVGYAFVHMSPDLVCQNRLRCPVATAITQGALRPEQKASSKHISPLSYCHPLVQSGLAPNVLTCPILPLWILWLAKQTTAGSTKTGWNYTSTPQAPHPASSVQECHWIRTSAIHRLLSSIWGCTSIPCPKFTLGCKNRAHVVVSEQNTCDTLHHLSCKFLQVALYPHCTHTIL